MSDGLTSRARELRKNMTPQERKLWYCFLRSYPVRFMRQRVIGNYIVDFYCAKARLAVELDGSQHFTAEQERYDLQRTQYLESVGISVVRIPNNYVNDNFNAVCEYLDGIVRRSLSHSLRS